MKPNDKITEKNVIDLLKVVGLEKDKSGGFYCHDAETNIDVNIKGNQLIDLLLFIKNYYYDLGYKYGTKHGAIMKLNEIKKILEIKS